MAVRLMMVVLVLAVAGCTSSMLEAADREGEEIKAEKLVVVDHERENLLDPNDPETAGTPDDTPVPSDEIEIPEKISLEDAIRIATAYNRSYLTQRDSFFLTALGLGLTRFQFLEPQFAGSISYNATDPASLQLTDTTSLALSGTQRLYTGGTLGVSGGLSQGTALDMNGSRVQNAGGSLAVNFSQPLLRGAGHTIAFEGLTQAERSAVYSARNFEVFRQSFAIDVIARYYTLVAQKKRLANQEQNVARQLYGLRKAQARYRLQRGTQADAFRAEQNYRDAQNAKLDAQTDYERALDDLKIFLGIPLSSEFDVADEVPEVDPLVVDVHAAVSAALHNRLDVRTRRDQLQDAERGVRIARNAMLPDLDLSASFSTSPVTGTAIGNLNFGLETFNFGIALELPFNRKAERNALRAALIGLAQDRRSLREFEDGIILQVRDLVRNLRRQLRQIDNDEKTVKTLERRVLQADMDARSGRASNRDFVEANNELTSAQNTLLDKYVAYNTARLRLIQELGLLFVDEEGNILK